MDVGCLAVLFPEIFNLAVDKNAFVKDYCNGYGINQTWAVLFRRNLNDWEVEEYMVLLELLNDVYLKDVEDSMIWNASKNQMFTVKSFYLALLGEGIDVFPWTRLWNKAVPPRVLFFSWCAAKGKILTMDNLKLRGYSLVNRCILCLREEESITHLLLHCPWSAEIWSLILSCFEVSFCFPNHLCDFLLAWWGQPFGKQKKVVWNVVPFYVFWLIWQERNRRIFEDVRRSIFKIKGFILNCLHSWVTDGKECDIFSLLRFLDDLR